SILACTAGVVRTAAALPADDWRDLLNQFVRLKFRGEFFWNGSNQCNASIFCTREKNWTAEFRLQRVHDCLQQFSVRLRHFGDAEIFASLRREQLRRDLSSPASQFCLSRFRCLLFPFTNFGI